jgi:histone deacetylase complex subunit SAP18
VLSDRHPQKQIPKNSNIETKMNRSRGYDDDDRHANRRSFPQKRSYNERNQHRGGYYRQKPRRGGFKRQSSGGGGSFLRPTKVIDRQKTCPLLLRAFPYDQEISEKRQDGMPQLRRPDEYATQDGLSGMKECRLYTWKDATLGELADMIRKEMGRSDIKMAFSLVYPDARGRMVMRKIGKDMNDTLEKLDFQIGDYLDVCCRPE